MPPKGQFNVWRHLWLTQLWGGVLLHGVAEARDAAQHPKMPRAAPPRSTVHCECHRRHGRGPLSPREKTPLSAASKPRSRHLQL